MCQEQTTHASFSKIFEHLLYKLFVLLVKLKTKKFLVFLLPYLCGNSVHI